MYNYYEYSVLNEGVTESQLDQIKSICASVDDLESIDEGVLSSIIGVLGGGVVGPKIGKMLAKVLGVESGLLYNFLTSPVVGAALGYELLNSKKKEKSDEK